MDYIPELQEKKYSKEELKGWWAAYCPKCHWEGLSKGASGGHQLADSGDYTDIICPKCQAEVEDVGEFYYENHPKIINSLEAGNKELKEELKETQRYLDIVKKKVGVAELLKCMSEFLKTAPKEGS